MQHKSILGGKQLKSLKCVQFTLWDPPAARTTPSVYAKHLFKRQKQFYHREAPTKPWTPFKFLLSED